MTVTSKYKMNMKSNKDKKAFGKYREGGMAKTSGMTPKGKRASVMGTKYDKGK